MANPFAQFDQGNPFSQFGAKEVNPFAQFDHPQPLEGAPSAIKAAGAIGSMLSGIPASAAGLAGAGIDAAAKGLGVDVLPTDDDFMTRYQKLSGQLTVPPGSTAGEKGLEKFGQGMDYIHSKATNAIIDNPDLDPLALQEKYGYSDEQIRDLMKKRQYQSEKERLSREEESQQRLIGGISNSLVGNFTPVGGVVAAAAKKGGPLRPIDVTASKIADAIKAKAEVEKPGQSTPEYSGQGELNLEPPVTDTTNMRNPYDAAGYVSDSNKGMSTDIQSPQMDLFGDAQGKDQPVGMPPNDLFKGAPDVPSEPPRPPEPTPPPRGDTIDLTAKDKWKEYIQPQVDDMFKGMKDKLTQALDSAKIDQALRDKGLMETTTKEHQYDLMELQREAGKFADLDAMRNSVQEGHRAVMVDTTRKLHKFVDDTGVVDHIGVLTQIWKSATDPLLRGMAKFLLDNPEIIKDHRVIAILDRNGDVVPRFTDENGSHYIGEYFDANHTTYLSNAGLTERTFMHEIVHAATVRAYKTNPALKAKVDAIFAELKSRLREGLIETDEGRMLKVTKHDKGWVYHYGLTHPLEMLAEVFTNPKFREFLSNTAPYRTLWTKMLDTIKDVMGIKSTGQLNNFLGRIDAVGKELMDFHSDTQLSNEQVYKTMKAATESDWPTRMADFESPLQKDAHQREVLNGIPGMRELGKNMIPDYRPIDEVMAQVANEKDTKGPDAFISGGIQKAEMKKSSALYAIYDWFSTADKKANFADRTNIGPAEKLINNLYNKEPISMRMLFNILTQEAEHGVRMSREELMDLGVKDSVIEAHDAFRSMMDDVFQKQVEKGAQMTGKEGYFASRWNGPWGMGVTKDGKVVWMIREQTRSRALAAQKYLEANVPGLDPIGPPKYRESPMADKANNVEAGYNELKDLLGEDDPAVQSLKKAWEDYQQLEGIKALDQSKHWQPNSGVRGYAGDRPWVKSDKDILDAMKSQFQYARNGYRWAELQSAIELSKQLVKGLDDKPNTKRMVRDYTKNQLGVGTDPIIRRIESKVGEQISKISPLSGNEMAENLRSLFYIKTLGVFNVPFSITSLVQPIFTGPEHFRLSFDGYKHNPVTSIADSFHDGLAILWDCISELAPNSDLAQRISGIADRKIKDPFIREMAEYTRQNGIVSINQFSDINSIGHPIRQFVENVGGANLIATEAASRAMAFAGFVSHLKQSGKFTDNMAIFKRAEELTNLTMVDYRHFERSTGFNKLGFTGRMLSTLQTFHVNQWNNLWRYAKLAKEGNVMPLISMMATQFVFAGTTGWFGVNALDATLETLKSHLPASWMKKWQDFGIKKYMITHMPDYLSYGPASKVTGVNWSTRFDAGNIMDPSFEGMLPFAADAAKTGKSMYNLAKDQDSGRARDLAYQMAPASLKGAVDAGLYDKGPGPNDTRRYGATSDYTEGAPTYRTQQDINPRWLGLRTNKEAANKDLNYRDRIHEQEKIANRQSAMDDFKRGLLSGDKEKATEAVKLFVELDGDPKTISQTVKDTMTKQYLDQTQQILIKANASITAAKRAGERKEQSDYIKKNYK